jgi:hypothetical protein
MYIPTYNTTLSKYVLYQLKIIAGVATVENEEDYIDIDSLVLNRNFYIICSQNLDLIYLVAEGNDQYANIYKIDPITSAFSTTTISTIWTSSVDYDFGFNILYVNEISDSIVFYDNTRVLENNTKNKVVHLNLINDVTTEYEIENIDYPNSGDSYYRPIMSTDRIWYHVPGDVTVNNFGIINGVT